MNNLTFDDTNIIDDDDCGQSDGDCLSLKCPQCGNFYEHPDCWNCGYIKGVDTDETPYLLSDSLDACLNRRVDEASDEIAALERRV